MLDQRASKTAFPKPDRQPKGMLRNSCAAVCAQYVLNEGEWPLVADEALLASIATNHLLLPHFAIRKHEF
jgi:hypothetical protein